jgi:NAD-dependent SIR2 family protein deacetylase
MDKGSNIVILTGAGVSAESGLATFRGPDGLWEGHRVEDVATPGAFARARGSGKSSRMRRMGRSRAWTGNGRAIC